MVEVSQLTPDLPSDLHYRDRMPNDGSGVLRLGQLINGARQDKRWTQKDLAEESGASLETIKRYENGKIKDPDSELVRSIIKALGISVLEIPIALGHVTREELDLPPAPARTFTPTVEEAIAILEDPDMSDEAKHGALQYLRYLRANNPGTGKPGASTGQPRAS